MRLPRGKALLENTNIDFINFDKILNAGKRERSHKINGYISLIYPQDVDIIFLSLGEPYSAVRFKAAKKSQLAITDAINRAKDSDVGIINIYEIPEELVLIVNSTLHNDPVFELKSASEMMPEKMMTQMAKDKINGFLEIKKGPELFYAILENGMPNRGYFADKLNVKISPQILLKILKATANDGSPVLYSMYDKMPQKIEQVTPALNQLLLKSINSIIVEFASSYGPTFAKKGLRLAKSHIDDEYEFMQTYTFNSLELQGDAIAPKDEFVKAFAEFVNRFMKTYDGICPDEAKKRLFKEALKDFRFALKSANFFNYTLFKDE
ncbi:MAG: hypothetical protein R6U31_02585 [bacterium]